jgi:hypothetical protein
VKRLSLMAGALLTTAPVAFAAHPDRLVELRANLDADPARERVVGVESTTVDHARSLAHVTIFDRCAGREREHRLTPTFLRLGDVKIVQADGRGRSEVLAVVNGTENEGEAKIVRLIRLPNTWCPVPRALFAYRADRPPAPRMTDLPLVNFRVAVVELERRYGGRELRLTEYYQARGMLSSRTRELLYRYVRAMDRYVRYRTTVGGTP